MFDIPGFDPRSMTDDELLRRQEDLEARLNYAARSGGAGEMFAQLRAMLDSIEHTRRERMFLEMAGSGGTADPVVIETDPSLRPRQPEADAAPHAIRHTPARRTTPIAVPRATERPAPPAKKESGS